MNGWDRLEAQEAAGYKTIQTSSIECMRLRELWQLMSGSDDVDSKVSLSMSSVGGRPFHDVP